MLRDGDPSLRIYLMGIGGAGLSALAQVLHEQGYQVSGSDMQASPVTTKLEQLGVKVILDQSGDYLRQLEPVRHPHIVVYSSAIPESNPEWRQAVALGLPMANRAAFMPALLADRTVIAISGTHGKSTTTSMIVQALLTAQRDPGYIVGFSHKSLPSGHAGTESLFIIEADEYAGMFLGLYPTMAVVMAMDWDHPDCYPTPATMHEAYYQFLSQVKEDGSIVYNQEDANLQGWASTRREDSRQLISFGQTGQVDWQIQPVTQNVSAFRLYCAASGCQHTIELPVIGHHNQYNAAAAWLVARLAGLSPIQATQGLKAFTPLNRRFQFRGQYAGITLVDDYAHHPRAVAVTLQASRLHQPAGRVWAVFQPCTYSRTQALLADFRKAFADADRVIILGTSAGREEPWAGVGGDTLAAVIEHPDVAYCPTHTEALTRLTQLGTPGDLILVMGAGDCWRLSDMLIEHFTQT